MARPILLVLASTLPLAKGDGTPSFVLDLALEQAKQFEVTIIAPAVVGSSKHHVIDGVSISRFRYWPFAHTLADGSILDNLKSRPANWLQVPFLFLGLFRELRSQLKKHPEALIHAHWIFPQGLVAALAKGKSPLLITVHGGDIYALKFLDSLKRWVLGRAKAVTTVNKDMKEQLELGGVSSLKVSVLPMGTDFSLFSSESKVRSPNRVLAVGRLVEKKGIEVLIQALKFGLENKLLPEDIEVVIAGSGPLEQKLKGLAGSLPVSFLGNQPKSEISKLLAQTGVFVIPSVIAKSGDREGLPVTLMEAAASSTCVVASRLSGIEELVIDNHNGLLVDPGDHQQLARALSKLLADEDLRVRFGRQLREDSSRFDIVEVGKRYNELLRSI